MRSFIEAMYATTHIPAIMCVVFKFFGLILFIRRLTENEVYLTLISSVFPREVSQGDALAIDLCILFNQDEKRDDREDDSGCKMTDNDVRKSPPTLIKTSAYSQHDGTVALEGHHHINFSIA